MNTPSKEALEASSAIVRSLGITEEDRDLLAAIIDRHFEPLRKRLAEMESLLASEKTTRNAIIAKGQQAEARVKELEAERNGALETLESVRSQYNALRAANAELEQSLATEAHESNMAILRLQQANAELAGALRDAAAFARNMEQLAYGGIEEIDDEECVSLACRAEAALARHAAGEPAKHPDTERLEFAFAHDMIVSRRMQSWIGNRDQFDAQREEWECDTARKEVQP